MNEIDLRGADLNLLVVFQRLLAERHVGRAAKRLRLTQSAASHALGRARVMFGDPLFVRHPKGIEPTPRALALAPIIADILDRANCMLASSLGFDPKEPSTFTIGGTDLGVFTVLVPLIKRLRETAPNVDLRVRSLDGTRVIPAFDRQEVDCALMPFPEVPARIAREPAIEESFVGIARRGHPAFRRKQITAANWAALPHLLVSPRGENSGEADEHLGKLGLKRKGRRCGPAFSCRAYNCGEQRSRYAHHQAGRAPFCQEARSHDVQAADSDARFYHRRSYERCASDRPRTSVAAQSDIANLQRGRHWH